MASHIIFVTAPFNVEDIPLGTLVPDVRYPNQDALSKFATLPPEKFSKRQQNNLKGDLDSQKHRSFTAQLTRLLTLSAAKKQNANFTLQAEKGWIYELRQPKELFKELCAMEGVRRWLKEGMEAQQESYFVLGLRTFENATVGRGVDFTRRREAGVVVPVGEIVQANTGINPGDAVDVKGKVEDSKEEKAQEAFETPGEQVYAIEYRKIVMKKRDADAPPALAKDNVWRYYSDNRATGTEEDYEEYEALLSADEIPQGSQFQRVEGVDQEVILLPV